MNDKDSNHEKQSVSPDPDLSTEQRRVEIFEQHRSLLFSIAYRMLGTVADAEDMLQETFIRWQKTADVEIQSPRAFLVTIISRLCIKHLQLARVQREEYLGPWLPEPLLTGPAADPSAASAIDESLSIGFLVLLERLTPVERAVFLLREVFDYDYEEVARITGLNETNCRQILRRARQHVKDGRPRFTASTKEAQEILRRFLKASMNGDMEGLVSLLSNDIVLYADGGGKARALPGPIHGPQEVAEVFVALRKFTSANVVMRLMQVNGQPGCISYLDGQANTVLTVNVVDGKIRNIFIVRNPEKLRRMTGVNEQADDKIQ